jgi:membrane protein
MALRLWDRYNEVAIGDAAARLAYSMLFALFAFLFVLVTLAAYLPIQPIVTESLTRLGDFVPEEVVDLIRRQLAHLFDQPRPRLLGFSLLVALYTTSRGVDAMRITLNQAYHVRERRSYLRTQVTSVVVAIAGSAFILSATTLVVLGGRLGLDLMAFFGVRTEFVRIWAFMRWPIATGGALLVLPVAYHVLPDVDDRLRPFTPGSVVGAVGWVISTWAFTFWTERMSSANATYSSIAGVMLLLTWLYLSAFMFLLGGLVNAVWRPEPPENRLRVT